MNYKEKLKLFLQKKSKKPKIIVIFGPTACWKTWMWIEIAKEINSEIISTDSRQIFKYLDIWTGKATLEEMSWVKHHMIDIITPDTNYSVWEFKKQSEKIIWELLNNWKIPILVGWTGLYIDSLIYDFLIPEVPADENLRKILENEAEKYWKEYVFEKLKKLDPDYALELHPNNLNYVIRAIEVKMITWKSKRDFRTNKIFKYETLFLTPYNWDREALYTKINLRVQQMFDKWLVEEVQNILKMWYKKTDFWMKTIWYKEVIEYLEWKLSLKECIEKVQQFNRNYAKRQITWFWKYEK